MQVTVGISPGSRHTGIAVVRNKQLIAWRIHTFKGKWSTRKEATVIAAFQKLFASYPVEAVSVKLPDVFPDSLAFSQLLGVINNICERQGLRADYYTLSEIKQQYSRNPKVNKHAIVALLAHQHPELKAEYQKSQSSKSRYYVRIFEAIAATYAQTQP